MMTKSKTAGNYVNSVLAKAEVKKAGYDEAIMLDTEGYVSEASGENIFIVRDGKIKTTPLTSILPGITRDSIITLARDKGYEVVEERFTRDELYIADEAFFTGTAAELTPIREVDDRQIGAGSRGPMTEDIQKAFFDVIKGKEREVQKMACLRLDRRRLSRFFLEPSQLERQIIIDGRYSRADAAGYHVAARYQRARHHLWRSDLEPYRLGGRHRRVAPSARNFVTRAMRAVEFIAPVYVGDVVSFYTTVVREGTTSITVKVSVEAERGREPRLGSRLPKPK